MTEPVRVTVGFALRSRISACSRIWSSSACTFGALLGRDLRVQHLAAELLEHDAVRRAVPA